jgi:hypothetical protein
VVAQEPLRLSVNADPPADLAEKTARILNCSLEEAYRVLSHPPRPTPKEDPLLPLSLPASETPADQT